VTENHTEDSSTQPPSTGSRAARSAVVAVLVTVLVLLLVPAGAAVWGYTRLSAVEDRLDARADVLRVAEQFTVAVNNYDASSIEDYRSDVGALLSTKFQGEYDKTMEKVVPQVQQAEMSSEGEVLSSGVATVDDDSARVLVVADATVKTVYDERQRHFRWEVSLVKVDGEWLVDDFTPVM
jgi:hypothetical protein